MDSFADECYGFAAVDGGTLCIDSYLCLVEEEELLAELSRKVGRVLAMFLATHSGSAGFSVYEDGERVRRVFSEDGELTVVGKPIPEEASAGLAKLRSFYWAESDRLWQAFGLGKEAGDYTGRVSVIAGGALRKVTKTEPAKKKTAKKTAKKKPTRKKPAKKRAR